MSGDPEQEYFSDGITEDIITDLSKVSALGIIARNSAFMYKEKNVDILKVARELKVTHVLEGSVRKAGGRIRINAQLVDGETNSHVWADRYDRDSSDIFALQDEISEAIVKALKLRLLPEEKKAIEHLEQCLAIAQRIKYSEVESECDVNLGELALDAGDTAAASKRFSRALAVCRDAGNRRGESTALWWLGKIDRVRGDLHAARVRLGGALRAFRAYEMHEELLGCLEDHAALWHALGNDAEAARMHAAVDVSRQRLALRRSPRAEARIRATIASLRAAMGDTAFDTAWSAGTRWEIGEAAAEALALAPEEAALA